ncbi:hypothetical protein MNBD_BACTEROID01-1824 [hydrothermal vent metagenome]|uniref:Uncharacterized protein n=1 Tax=hydrothermal vent metagenome TaxID=652676 RepID=A0A3B0TZH0_9ZZZZ
MERRVLVKNYNKYFLPCNLSFKLQYICLTLFFTENIMAKKKKKKNVAQLPTSTDNLIRARARNLELHECYISSEWEGSREANIIVSRKHTNGHITFGVFLVDLALLGVKDVFYQFNEPEFRFNEIIGNYNELELEAEHFIKVEYNFVHNIIYGAVEYAADYGFKPHKSFSVGQYILEEDDENIPLIDIDFGLDGLPAVFTTSEKPMLKEIEQLKKEAGHGNFLIVHLDEDDKDEYEEEWQDGDENMMPGWDDDIEEMGVPGWDIKEWETFFSGKPEDFSFRALQYIADSISYECYLDADFDAFEIVLGDATYSEYFQEELPKKEGELLKKVDKLIEDGDNEGAYKLLEEGKKEFPGSVPIYLLSLIKDIAQKNKNDLIEDYEVLYNHFTDNLSVKCLYASMQIENGNYDKVPEIFEDKFSLKELYPHRKKYSEADVIQFCTVLLGYFLEKDDLKAAEPYYQVLDTIGNLNMLSKSLLQELVLKKLDLISEGGAIDTNNLRIVK